MSDLTVLYRDVVDERADLNSPAEIAGEMLARLPGCDCLGCVLLRETLPGWVRWQHGKGRAQALDAVLSYGESPEAAASVLAGQPAGAVAVGSSRQTHRRRHTRRAMHLLPRPTPTHASSAPAKAGPPAALSALPGVTATARTTPFAMSPRSTSSPASGAPRAPYTASPTRPTDPRAGGPTTEGTPAP